MLRIAWSGLRARLLLLVLIAILPALGLILYTAVEQRQLAIVDAQAQALRLARVASLEQSQVFEGARQLLVGLAQSPAVLRHDGPACSALFSGILRRFPIYVNVSAARPSGEVFCSGLPLAAPTSFTDRAYFQHAVTTGGFSISEYVIGRVSGKATIAVAHPAVDDVGRVRAVVVAGLNLSWLNHLSTDAQLPNGATLTVVDRNGMILAHYPNGTNWVGKAVPDAPIVKAILAKRAEGTASTLGPAGTPRLFGFTRLAVSSEAGDVYVTVGIPNAIAFAAADRALVRNLVWLAVASAVAFLAAWVTGDLVILRRVRALIGATERLAAGDLSARTGFPRGTEELGQLARAFDKMAGSLEEQRDHLREAEARYRALVEQSLVGVYLTAAEHILYINQAGAEIFGYQPGEVVGRLGPMDLVDPGDRARVAEKIQARLRGDVEALRYTFQGLRKDGAGIHCEVFGRRILYGGRPAILGTLVDITERARAEQELRTVNRALRMVSESSQRLVRATEETQLLREICRVVVEVGGYRMAWAGFAEHDEAKTVRPVAQAGDEAAYLERIQMTWADTELGRGPVGTAIRSGRPWVIRDIQADSRFGPLRAEAMKRGYASVIALPLMAEGQAFGALAIYAGRPDAFEPEEVQLLCGLTDDLVYGITALHTQAQRDRAEEEMHRQQEVRYQSQKLADMGTLLAGVAHELNNPLTVITGRAALLRQAAEGGPLAAQADKIVQAAERCARIVRNFLALARQHPPERREVRLNEVVQEALELVAYSLRVDNIEVGLDLAEDLPTLWGDPHQLHQVVVNLLTNAHQAMRQVPGLRRLTLSTRPDPQRRVLQLRVADSGPGVPPEIRARIFEPFFTTKPVGQGTGLGLSLCQSIVEGHGGLIRLDSKPGQGAVFVIDLPIGAPSGFAAPTEAAAALPLLQGKTILVVDDEPEVANLLADMFSAAGCEVETAANGVEALRRIERRAYDLILSDLRMPEMDGPGLYRRIERQFPRLLPRIIFLTGDTLGHEVRQFLEGTAAPSVTKPFNPDEVARVVRRVLLAAEAGSQAPS